MEVMRAWASQAPLPRGLMASWHEGHEQVGTLARKTRAWCPACRVIVFLPLGFPPRLTTHPRTPRGKRLHWRRG